MLKFLLRIALFLCLSLTLTAQGTQQLLRSIEEGDAAEVDWASAVRLLGKQELRQKVEKAFAKRKPFPKKELVALLTHQQLIVRNGALEILEFAASDDFGFNPWFEPNTNEANTEALNRWTTWAGSSATVETKNTKLSEEQIANYIQQLLSDDRARIARATRMLENDNFRAVAAIQKFINKHPELPKSKTLQLKQAQYELVLIKASRASASSLARDLVKGNRDQQLSALSKLKKLGLITIPIIRDYTGSDDALMREVAIDALLSVGGEQVLPLVIDDLRNEKDVNVLHIALRNIKEIKNDQSLAIVVELLDHPDEDIIVSAVQALTKLIGDDNRYSSSRAKTVSTKHAQVHEKVITLLNDPRWRVRDAAVQLITKVKIEAAGDEILRLLKEDSDDFVRSHCIEAAIALKLTKGLPLLTQLFKEHDELIGPLTPAILELAKVMPSELLEHLKTRDPDTIILSLSKFTDDTKAQLSVLCSYATHENIDVACTALRILSNYDDKVEQNYVANTLTDALRSGSDEKIEAILSSLDLPRLGTTDPRLRSTSIVLKDRLPSPLDPLYDAFLKPNGKPLSPVAVEIKTDASGGVRTLVDTLANLARTTDNSKRRFQICLLLTKAGDERGLQMVSENVAEMPISKRASLAEALYNPTSKETLNVFDALLQDPADDIRNEAGTNAISNEHNVELIIRALDHLTREDTKLRAHELYSYHFSSALRTPNTLRSMTSWAYQALSKDDLSDEVAILALTTLSKSNRLAEPDVVIAKTNSENHWVRRAAWHTLAVTNSNHYKENITKVATDTSAHVRVVLPEVTSKEDSEWKIHFNDKDTARDNSYSSTRRRRVLNEESESALRSIVQNDSSPINRFEAAFSLLNHSKDIDLDNFLSSLSKLPKEVRAPYRLANYVEDNYTKMGKGMRPILAYVDFKYIDNRKHKLIITHFKADDSEESSFNSFEKLAETTKTTDAPQHLEVEENTEVVERDRMVVLFFEKEGCKQCAKALEIVNDLKKDFPIMQIQSVSMSSNDGIILNDHLSNKFNLPSNSIGKTPSFFTSHGYVVPPITPANLGKLLEETMDTPVQEGWFSIESPEAIAAAEQRVEERFDALTLPIVIAAGLLDGINPCAFATIIFFLSYLTVAKRSPKEIFFVGVAFILAIFLSYLSVGLLFNQVIGKLTNNPSYLWVKNVLNYVFAAFALLVSFLSLKDYWKARQGRLKDMTLQLPDFLKNRIRGVIRKGSKSSRFVISAFFSGIAISFLELACTGQVYLPIIYKVNQGAADATYMLVLYNLAFILPLIIIFGLAMGGMKSNALIAFQQKHTSTVKLLTGLLFLLLAAVLIFSDYFSEIIKNLQPSISGM